MREEHAMYEAIPDVLIEVCPVPYGVCAPLLRLFEVILQLLQYLD
jgi:hypothetical protein